MLMQKLVAMIVKKTAQKEHWIFLAEQIALSRTLLSGTLAFKSLDTLVQAS